MIMPITARGDHDVEARSTEFNSRSVPLQASAARVVALFEGSEVARTEGTDGHQERPGNPPLLILHLAQASKSRKGAVILGGGVGIERQG